MVSWLWNFILVRTAGRVRTCGAWGVIPDALPDERRSGGSAQEGRVKEEWSDHPELNTVSAVLMPGARPFLLPQLGLLQVVQAVVLGHLGRGQPPVLAEAAEWPGGHEPEQDASHAPDEAAAGPGPQGLV